MADTKKKLENMTPQERKAYNEKMAEVRKTPEFFTETAEKRVNKVLKAMNTLSFMGKYNGTDEQKEKIMVALNDGVEKVRTALYKGDKTKTDFKL